MKNIGGIKIIMIAALVLMILAGTGAAVSLSNSGGGTWKYQREISIKENSGTTLTDYQVLIELKGADFPVEAKSDGADVRFTDSRGNELNYWIDNWDNAGKSVKVWVKVQTISAGSSTVIRMYYGNPSASKVSSGDNTFEFFDDFESGNLDKWASMSGNWYWKNANGNGVIKQDDIPNNVGRITRAKMNPIRNFVMQAKWKGESGIYERYYWIGGRLDPTNYDSNINNIGVLLGYSDNTGTYKKKQVNGYWNSASEIYVNENFPNVFTDEKYIKIQVYENTAKLKSWLINSKEPEQWETATTSINPILNRAGYCWLGTANVAGWFDDVLISKYTTPEPTITLAPAKSSSLSITKSASPYSLRQFQESTIKVLIVNSGTSEVKAIEILDSIHPSFDLTGGDFPNPKKFDSIRAGESRELQYTIKSKESGAFTLDPATVTYADSEGNIQEVKSEALSIKVVPSSEGIASGASSGQPSGQSSKSASVSLTGEKTDVVLGEDILLKLSAVNLITKPKMHVQVIIIPPSGMSVTSTEFSKSGTNQFTTNYELEPGDGKDIEVKIKPNQIGDFNVNGRIIYYFGNETEKAEDHTLPLQIKVRKELGQTAPVGSADVPAKAPGFGGGIAIIGLLFMAIYIRKRF